MENKEFFAIESEKLEREAYMDNLRAEEYKRQFADIARSSDIKSMLSVTEKFPKPRRKPLKLRLREFIYRLKNTL